VQRHQEGRARAHDSGGAAAAGALVLRLVHDLDVLFRAQPTLEVPGVLRVGGDAAGEAGQQIVC